MEHLRTKLSQQVFLTLDKYSRGATKSTFQKTGKLTADEFVAAGDFLVENFPSWTWCAGLPDKARAHLPPDKQFLMTRNVPCFPREEKEVRESQIEITKDDAEGWISADIPQGEDAVDDDGVIAATEAAASTDAVPSVTDEDIDNEFEDCEVVGEGDIDFDELAIEDDDAAVAGNDEVGSHVKEMRTYDISIHYDTHYSTPRVWLFGYDAQRNPLTGTQWQEDFSPEHVNKTVTFEAHPHLGHSCPSIHPCKHAEAMKNMVELLSGSKGGLDPKVYLLIFLKFIQSMIPNIEYDYTSRFQMTQNEDDDSSAGAASGSA